MTVGDPRPGVQFSLVVYTFALLSTLRYLPRVVFGLVPLSIEVEVIAILVTICSNDDTEAAPESSRDHDEPVESIVVFLEF